MRKTLLLFLLPVLLWSGRLVAQDSLDVALVQLKGQWRLIDRQGQFLTGPLYESDISYPDRVWCMEEGMAVNKQNNRYHFIRIGDGQVLKGSYDSVRCFSRGLAAVLIGKKWGFINNAGKQVIPPRYDDVGDFDGKGMAVVSLREKSGVIDSTGREVWHTKWNRGYSGGTGLSFHDDLLPVSGEDGLIGFAGRSGLLMVPAIYTPVSLGGYYYFIDGQALVRRNDTTFVIDTRGKELFAVGPYEDCFHRGAYIRVAEEGRVGIMDRRGRWVLSPEAGYAGIDRADEGLYVAQRAAPDSSPRYRYIDSNGKDVFGSVFLEASGFEGGYASVVTHEGETTWIDRSGRPVFGNKEKALIAPQNDVACFRNDRVLAFKIMPNKTCSCHKATEYFGFLDRQGNWVIEPALEKADIFSCGLASAAATAEGGYGYIDEQGKWVIPPQFESAGRFQRIGLEFKSQK